MPRLTGPLLFREMFFHNRRWSWCRNPILPPTSASVCPKFIKLAYRRWPVTGFQWPGNFYPVPRHPVRAWYGAELCRPWLITLTNNIKLIYSAGLKKAYLPVTGGKCRNGTVYVPSVILWVSVEHRLASSAESIQLPNAMSWLGAGNQWKQPVWS